MCPPEDPEVSFSKEVADASPRGPSLAPPASLTSRTATRLCEGELLIRGYASHRDLGIERGRERRLAWWALQHSLRALLYVSVIYLSFRVFVFVCLRDRKSVV